MANCLAFSKVTLRVVEVSRADAFDSLVWRVALVGGRQTPASRH